ncbi:kinase-like domain-containing protein [Gigaspora rosea]|uniref:non-specific serine/threonine protein kinase n=1 Tax=Gigaspora rosea TaxID=44941 RepID=A0A397W856_9GLOM|nr:kinase-like domain-containing protein [Gigaspora rosea]
MTANKRSINDKSPITSSKFFAGSQSSDENSSDDSSNKRKGVATEEDYTSDEEFLLSSRGFIETPGSLDDSSLKVGSLVLNEIDEFDETDQPLNVNSSPFNPLQVATRNVHDYDSILESKRRQGRLLLVSLLENFCLLYDTNPEGNRKLFYVICKMLSAMGIIEEEYIDEMSTVRSSYQCAFKALVVQALNSIKQEQLMIESHMIMPPGSVSGVPENGKTFLVNHEEIKYHSHSSSPCSHYQPFNNLTFVNILDLENSRYNNDFIELKLLGKGGFASVWQAKNKLDGIEYAIKKIRLRDDKIPKEKEKIFREIKFLARLEHTNVVRYYSSWLEHVNSKHRCSDAFQIPTSSSHSTNFSDSLSSNESTQNNDGDYNADSDDDSDIFRMSFSDDEANSENYSGIDFKDDNSNLEGLHSTTSITGVTKRSSNKNNFRSELSNSYSRSTGKDNTDSSTSERDWVLFIQMQLCHSTLKDYLKRRDTNLLATKKDPLNSVDRHASIELFRGIVRGVAYIHEQGLIHRDLKPGNIFIGMVPDSNYDNDIWVATDNTSINVDRLVPKIGDFGLVTAVGDDNTDSSMDSFSKPDSSSSRNSNSNNRTLNHHGSSSSLTSKSRTIGVGTVTYASPEQLAKPPIPYNEKVDIYSLGIIFFELHFPFSTGHERVQVLKDLRHGILPNGFVQRFPKESAFILWMMAEDPDKRPNAKQILDFELLSGPIHGEHAELQHRLVENTQRIDIITKENEMLKKKVEELEKMLKDCECKNKK